MRVRVRVRGAEPRRARSVPRPCHPLTAREVVKRHAAAQGHWPRPPGFKKRPNTAGAQPMGGLPIEEFLAVMNGGGDSGDLVGKLMQLGISLASNAG